MTGKCHEERRGEERKGCWACAQIKQIKSLDKRRKEERECRELLLLIPPPPASPTLFRILVAKVNWSIVAPKPVFLNGRQRFA